MNFGLKSSKEPCESRQVLEAQHVLHHFLTKHGCRDLRMIVGCTVVCLLIGANCRIMFCLQVIGGD